MEPDDISMAADLLGMELDALQAEGIVVTHVERSTLALLAGTTEYTLPAETLDVFVGPDNVVGTVFVTGGAETPVRAISRAEYTAIAKKDTQSVPTLVFIERLAQVKAVFWCVPSVASTFRYNKIRLPRDMDTGTVTLDLARRWQKAICFSMAYHLSLAKSAPTTRVQFLLGEAERLKAIARASDVEKTNMQMWIDGPRYY
jgi:hypothetical protein